MADFNHSLELIKHDKYTKTVRNSIYDCLTILRSEQDRVYPQINETYKKLFELEPKIQKNHDDILFLTKQVGIFNDAVTSHSAKLLELTAADVKLNERITSAEGKIATTTNTINAINNKFTEYNKTLSDNLKKTNANSAELEKLYGMVNSDKMIAFEGVYINADDSIEGMTSETVIQGKTMQNLNPNDNDVYTATPGDNADVLMGYNFIPDEYYIAFMSITSDEDVPNGKQSALVFDGAWQSLGNYTKPLVKGVKTRIAIEFKVTTYANVNANPERQKIWVRTNRSITDIVVIRKNEWDGSIPPYFKGIRSACDIEKKFIPQLSPTTVLTKRWFRGYVNPNPGINHNKIVSDSTCISYIWKVKKGTIKTYKVGGNRNVLGFFDKDPKPGAIALQVVVEKNTITVPGDGWLVWYVSLATNGVDNDPSVCAITYSEQTLHPGYIEDLTPIKIESTRGGGLMQIPGSVRDTISRQGDSLVLTENITKIVLNGTSDHIYRRNSNTSGYVLFYLEIIDLKWQIKHEYAICDNYPVLPVGKQAASEFNFKYAKPNGKYLFVNVANANLQPYGGDSVTAFRKYLEANPITVYYYSNTTTTKIIEDANDMEFKTNPENYGTLIQSSNEIAPVIKTKVPCNLNALIQTLQRTNRSLQDDNTNLMSRMATVDEIKRQNDLHQAEVDLDVDFRLYMMEREKPGLLKTVEHEYPSRQYELMKKLIEAQQYDKNDFINKCIYYTDGGVMSQNEYKEITNMMKGGNI